MYIVFHDRNWTWIKFPGVPSEDIRTAIKERFGARWGRKKVAWYIKDVIVPLSDIAEAIGSAALGLVEGRAPTKTWEYCMQLIQLSFTDAPMQAQAGDKPVVKASPPKPKGNTKLAAKLRAMADRLTAKIEDKRRPMTQNPTPKRNKEYAIRLHDGANLERLQKALYALADLHEAGECPAILADLTTKKAIEPLVATRGKLEGYYSYYDSMEFSYDTEQARALQALIIGSPEEQEARRKEEQLARMENEVKLLVGKIPGFFPTPENVVYQLLQHADIRAGMSVLEPSAGSGAIADIIRREHPDIELWCVEINHTLRELLALKGHKLTCTGADFLNYPPARTDSDGFNRIVMNPPFEKQQDIDHVRHAYDCLQEGGRLVSVMSESAFFNTNKKATAFREWLEDVGGYDYELPYGAFLPYTSVKTRFVVIDK